VHELAIAQSVLDIVLEEGRRHDLKRINTIRLQVGALAAVVPEALTFCFEMISQNTVVAGALLVIETLPVVARCPCCADVFEVTDHAFVCPQCQEPAMDLVSGRELTVLSIEGETGEGNE
jgi:hydrogenase nickel incorporation protein HypA/HybF